MMDVCEDENCPGCQMERLIHQCSDEGWDPEMVIRMFFDYMHEAYDKEYDVIVGKASEVLH
jgi:chorismate mutase